MMRNKDFYLYQCADMLFTFSCRAFGMLFAWKMIEHYHLAVELGWFISLAWLLQVLILLGMGFVLERVRKKTIPLLCVVIGFICMMTLHLFMENSPLGLGGDLFNNVLIEYCDSTYWRNRDSQYLSR